MLNSQTCNDTRLRQELKVATPIKRGKSKGARVIQEYLALHGISVVIDGDFGPATAAGLDKFCQQQGIPAAQFVDQQLMDRLAQPLLRAIAPLPPEPTLGETVVALARQHLQQHPIEVGGDNKGPWVRLYMTGSEGKHYRWCAGFVTYIVRDAAGAHQMAAPLKRTFSCDNLATEAITEQRYARRNSPAQARPGSIFLVPHKKNSGDWVHTGLITGGNGTVFSTIEGNTCDDGSSNGFEVCARIRSCANVDVITI